ncbi:MAG: ABC transporter permease [Chloroflexi bacterium]|nr:ABC transporter permease [Chloroflexota bacterium]
MLKLAIRNLLHDRGRFLISASGIALAIVLILVMRGIFAGSEEHAVAYVRNQPAALWLMQSGVENMHMSTSILAPQTVELAAQVEGVDAVVGLLYAGGAVDLAGQPAYSYIFAVDADAPFGGPWELAEGRRALEFDEVIVDADLAARYGLGLGDTVRIFETDLRIAGLSRGTFGIATSITFVNKQQLAQWMGVPPEAASYILIRPEAGYLVGDLAERLKQAIPDANLLTQEEFIQSDKQMIRQMGADIIRAMNLVAYTVGMLVIGLTIYTATLERAREFAVLKAIGATSGRLLGVVFAQAFVSTLLGGLLGAALAWVLGQVIGGVLPEMLVLLEPDYLLAQIPVVLAVTGLAALIPTGRILRLDPMTVFRE